MLMWMVMRQIEKRKLLMSVVAHGRRIGSDRHLPGRYSLLFEDPFFDSYSLREANVLATTDPHSFRHVTVDLPDLMTLIIEHQVGRIRAFDGEHLDVQSYFPSLKAVGDGVCCPTPSPTSARLRPT